jgi:hypothetical protein
MPKRRQLISGVEPLSSIQRLDAEIQAKQEELRLMHAERMEVIGKAVAKLAEHDSDAYATVAKAIQAYSLTKAEMALVPEFLKGPAT